MNILITGSHGFIGKNLVAELKNRGYSDIFEFDRDVNQDKLEEFAKSADFVYHLAGINRPKDTSEFMTGNYGLTDTLFNALKAHNNTCPVMISSSIQAERDNPYGESKRAAEQLAFDYSADTGAKVLVYRLPNVFGKWCKPNYNSVIATFCHNIAHDIDIQINDRATMLNLVYIDDVVNELINALDGKESYIDKYCTVPIKYDRALGDIADVIQSFKISRTNRYIPDFQDEFIKKLYSTYLSYLKKDDFAYDLVMHKDNRGSFSEFIRTLGAGQVSVNISKPHVMKGEHWHHTKNEKFLVVAGAGVIRFRKIDEDEVIEYHVSGEKMTVVDVPVGYTHNIENTGDTDLITIIWVNECFDPNKPDTYPLEV